MEYIREALLLTGISSGAAFSGLLRKEENLKKAHTVTMHNWRLLLLAFVAVFQPIASFTEQNLIDGRQQCCDHQPHSLLRDTRLSLGGAHRIRKIPEDRRLNQRNDVREDRRDEARVYDSGLDVLSTDRLREIRERRVPSELAFRLHRPDYQLERVIAGGQRLERLVPGARASSVRRTRVVERADNDRRSQSRLSRDFSQENRRKNMEPTRNRLSRDESRRVFGEQKFQIKSGSHRETTRADSSSAELRTTIFSRESDSMFNRERTNVAKETSDNRNRHIARDTTGVNRRETLRIESWVHSDNRRRSLNRRAREVPNEHRRSASSESRIDDHIRDKLGERRINSREQSQEERRDVTERFDDRRNQREASRDRRLVNRLTSSAGRHFREPARRSRIMEDQRKIVNEIGTRMHNRKELRTIMQTRRTESRRMEREINHGRLTRDRRSRSAGGLNSRDIRHEAKHRTYDDSLNRDVSWVGDEHRIGAKNADRYTIEARIRNSESARNRMNLHYFNQKPDNEASMNWQLVFYTLQGIYLCGLLMQVITENESGSLKPKSQHWWYSPSTLIKVD